MANFKLQGLTLNNQWKDISTHGSEAQAITGLEQRIKSGSGKSSYKALRVIDSSGNQSYMQNF